MKLSSTVTIHKNGSVTYWSWLRHVETTALPENIDPLDLARMTSVDRNRLINRFGLIKHGSGEWLRSAAERGWR